MIALLQGKIEGLLWNPQLPHMHVIPRVAVQTLRYPYALVRDALSGQLNLRAMGLVYTTLLSIVPLLALSFSVLKGFGVHREFEPLLRQFLTPLGAKGLEMSDKVIEFVDKVRVDVLGAVGLAFLIYTVISLLQKVEESFNFVWSVERSRSLGRRLSEYLSVMLVGPVAMFVALAMIASVTSHTLVQKLSTIEPFGATMLLIGNLGPFFLVVMVFSFVYGFVPNTPVRAWCAMVGGLVAGITWAATGHLFASFVVSSSNYEAVYSSFAIVLLALIWLYINWLILLFGAQLTFYLQNPQLLRAGRRSARVNHRDRERLALMVMHVIGQAFMTGGTRWSQRTLAERLSVPDTALGPLIRRLVRRRLLLETESGELMPARDLANIQLHEIVLAVRHGVTVPFINAPSGAVDTVVREMETAIGDSLKGLSLKSLIESGSGGAADTRAVGPDGAEAPVDTFGA